MFEIAKASFAQEPGGVDLLGLQTAYEKAYTNEIMPGITVLTRDVRYYALICWALSRKIDIEGEEFRRCEDNLTYMLNKIYARRTKGVSFLGIRKARRMGDTVPSDHYYQTSVWNQYKNSALKLGLLKTDRSALHGLRLTNSGEGLAKMFRLDSKFDVLVYPKRAKHPPRNLDKSTPGLKRFFCGLLFKSGTGAHKRAMYRKDLWNALKSDDGFHEYLAATATFPKLRDASRTALAIQNLTQALVLLSRSLPSARGKLCRYEELRGTTRSEITKCIQTAQKHLKQVKRAAIFDLHNIAEGITAKVIHNCVQRHIRVKGELGQEKVVLVSGSGYRSGSAEPPTW